MAYADKSDVTQFGVQDRHDRRSQEPGSQHHPGFCPRQKEDGRKIDQLQARHPWPPYLGHFEDVFDEVKEGVHQADPRISQDQKNMIRFLPAIFGSILICFKY